MPSIKTALVARDSMSHLAKRENWASQEAGVIVVFAIVFVVAVGLASLFISRWQKKRAHDGIERTKNDRGR
ncbi:hypothetical protein B0T24DRAFT_678773 [Lasiosphaeria ovina]|uniref:Uncharacterized protein n=1 Tax=Lasiosphaeria ovina TaxID=92902 RepID=A0AAE0KBY6_9PEZI|nr:hypothetical protein B0T24DRAFT_678773 [Lasiosphaeria ovina]